jgi:hypothetical protein
MILTIEETYSNDFFIINSSKNNVIVCIPVDTHLDGVVYDPATTIYTYPITTQTRYQSFTNDYNIEN